MSWPIHFTIKCPFCSLKLRSHGRSPPQVAHSLVNHLMYYHGASQEADDDDEKEDDNCMCVEDFVAINCPECF